MPCNLNLRSAVQWIHWAPPGDLDALFQAVNAKMKELGLTPGRRDNQKPEALDTDPQVNGRAVLRFVEGVEALTPADDLDENARVKASKLEAQANLCKLHATLAARLGAANYDPPQAEPKPEPPPLPAATPDPKPLA